MPAPGRTAPPAYRDSADTGPPVPGRTTPVRGEPAGAGPPAPGRAAPSRCRASVFAGPPVPGRAAPPGCEESAGAGPPVPGRADAPRLDGAEGIGRSRVVVSSGVSAGAARPEGPAPRAPGGVSGKRAEAGGGGGLTGSPASGTPPRAALRPAPGAPADAPSSALPAPVPGRDRPEPGRPPPPTGPVEPGGAASAPWPILGTRVGRDGPSCPLGVRGVKTDGSSSGSSSGRGEGNRAAGGGTWGRGGTRRASVLTAPPFPRARAVCRTRAVLLLGRARAEARSGHAYPYGWAGIQVQPARRSRRAVRARHSTGCHGRKRNRSVTPWHLPGTSPYPAVILSGRLPS